MQPEQLDLFGYTASNEAITAATNIEAKEPEKKKKEEDFTPCKGQTSFL